MRCRDDQLVPWPSGLSGPQSAAAPGSACRLYLWGTAGDPAFVHEFLAALDRHGKVARDAARALGSVMHFTTVAPGRRIPATADYARLGAGYVKRQCGLDEALWKFGLGNGTRVRIFAADVEGARASAIVLLTLTVKEGREDDWAAVRRAAEQVRTGDGR